MSTWGVSRKQGNEGGSQAFYKRFVKLGVLSTVDIFFRVKQSIS